MATARRILDFKTCTNIGFLPFSFLVKAARNNLFMHFVNSFWKNMHLMKNFGLFLFSVVFFVWVDVNLKTFILKIYVKFEIRFAT